MNSSNIFETFFAILNSCLVPLGMHGKYLVPSVVHEVLVPRNRVHHTQIERLLLPWRSQVVPLLFQDKVQIGVVTVTEENVAHCAERSYYEEISANVPDPRGFLR